MANWNWLNSALLLAIHDEQLAEHGGASGPRDEGLFESALARPLQVVAYGEPDVADLAAAYAYGQARNHVFIDGNKRTAFVALEAFLNFNGNELQADDVDCVLTMLAVAAGNIDETSLAEWIRQHLQHR